MWTPPFLSLCPGKAAGPHNRGFIMCKGFSGGASGIEPICQCRRHRETGSVPGSGRSPGRGHGNPLQYSCLENPMDGRAWWATVHRVAKGQTGLKQLSIHNGKESEDSTQELRLLMYPSATSAGSKVSINKIVSDSEDWLEKEHRMQKMNT